MSSPQPQLPPFPAYKGAGNGEADMPSPRGSAGKVGEAGEGPLLRFIRADVKVPKPRRGFDVLTVSWLPDEGWTCDCRRKTCDHLKAVKEALT